jgi:DSF synthase
MNTNNFGFKSDFKQIESKYDKSHEVLWTFMHQKNRIPCFNAELLSEITQHQLEIEQTGGVISADDQFFHIKYAVAASLTPGVFNLGGHLALIYELAKNRHREALVQYATKSIDALYHRISRFNGCNIITLSLLQGQTLGAGLEAALTSDVIIAERQSTLCFPEIMFNMFPGMGGYSLVARKVGTKIADEMIFGGKVYTAEQAHKMGLVDVLVEDGQGEKAVYNWIGQNRRLATGYLAIQKAKNCYHPITHKELMDITNIWVDTALKLSDRDLGIMERFIHSQEKQFLNIAANNASKNTISNVVQLKQSA